MQQSAQEPTETRAPLRFREGNAHMLILGSSVGDSGLWDDELVVCALRTVLPRANQLAQHLYATKRYKRYGKIWKKIQKRPAGFALLRFQSPIRTLDSSKDEARVVRQSRALSIVTKPRHQSRHHSQNTTRRIEHRVDPSLDVAQQNPSPDETARYEFCRFFPMCAFFPLSLSLSLSKECVFPRTPFESHAQRLPAKQRLSIRVTDTRYA